MQADVRHIRYVSTCSANGATCPALPSLESAVTSGVRVHSSMAYPVHYSAVTDASAKNKITGVGDALWLASESWPELSTALPSSS